ncbi:MAG: NAD(P)-dependent oxidoreductase [Verrucomicrobiales bacterium]|nr:NAD(P)-dependent oxidoreductase [Verrucomicrobiales bacterium]
MISAFEPNQKPTKIGLVGTGFMARGIAHVIDRSPYELSRMLTRRPLKSVTGIPQDPIITQQIAELIEHSDLIVVCCGDPVHVTDVVDQAIEAGLPIVTMDSEFHVTTGSWFVDKGLVTEAEGDQPGCLAALRRDAISMGFEPLIYGNVKGFLNLYPSKSDMQYWSSKQGLSIEQTTSFTDGTKVQIEQAFVANAFDADIYLQGMLGPQTDNVEEGSQLLADAANQRNEKSGKFRALSDYTLTPNFPGIFITAKHLDYCRPYLNYFKMGDGPYYTLTKSFHLCHLEVMKTIRAVIERGDVLMNNSSQPRISVATIAKRDLPRNHFIKHGIGSFDVRGETIEIADAADHVPIGLLMNGRLKHSVDKGQRISMDDIELPDTLAKTIWKKIAKRAVKRAASLKPADKAV